MPAPITAPTGYSGLWRVTIKSIQISKPTIDNATASDGAGDEIYAAAIVLRVDKATATKLGTSIVRSKEYGDIGNGSTWPNRIRAGSASQSGGIAAGNSVGDPGTPGAETFPIVLWEGDLPNTGEAVLIVPSIWERDTDDATFRNYSGNWSSNSAPVLGLPLVQAQYNSTSFSPITGTTDTGMIGPLNGAIYGAYEIPSDWMGTTVDRMIGINAFAGGLAYTEHMVVVTREKLSTLSMGSGVDLQIPLNENIPPGGTYMIVLRIERIA
jgi:hypothetical protein